MISSSLIVDWHKNDASNHCTLSRRQRASETEVLFPLRPTADGKIHISPSPACGRPYVQPARSHALHPSLQKPGVDQRGARATNRNHRDRRNSKDAGPVERSPTHDRRARCPILSDGVECAHVTAQGGQSARRPGPFARAASVCQCRARRPFPFGKGARIRLAAVGLFLRRAGGRPCCLLGRLPQGGNC